MSNVYWLKPAVTEGQRMSYGRGMSFRTELCSGDPEHAKSQIRPSPLRLVFTGGVTTDFSWTQYSEAVVTPEIAKIFREEGVTGCEFVPVELENTMGDEIATDLLEMRVFGWGGNASSKSGVRVLKECAYCKRQVFSGYTDASLVFDESKWDRSDIFFIWPIPRYIIVTSKVTHILRRHSFSGAVAAPLALLPKPIAGTLTPGQLRDWMERLDHRQLSGKKPY